MELKRCPLHCELNMNFQYYQRPMYTTDLVIIDGITRSGKFMAAHVLMALETVEPMVQSWLIDNLLYLHKLNKIDFETFKILFQTEVDDRTYMNMIGRSFNSRNSDASCIHKAAQADEYVKRCLNPNETELVQKYFDEKRIPIFITHEGMPNMAPVFQVFQNVKIIELIRNPIALVESWYRRGWGTRFGTDPKSIPIVFNDRNHNVPWFATGWNPHYNEIGVMDRIIMSMSKLFEESKKTFLSLDETSRNKIKIIPFEDLVCNTDSTVQKLELFLNRRKLNSMKRIIERERLNRKPENQKELLIRVAEHASDKYLKILNELNEDYNSFWLPLARGAK